MPTEIYNGLLITLLTEYEYGLLCFFTLDCGNAIASFRFSPISEQEFFSASIVFPYFLCISSSRPLAFVCFVRISRQSSRTKSLLFSSSFRSRWRWQIRLIFYISPFKVPHSYTQTHTACSTVNCSLDNVRSTSEEWEVDWASGNILYSILYTRMYDSWLYNNNLNLGTVPVMMMKMAD